MFCSKDAQDRAAMILRLNVELRQVQLDLLSARCATDRIRARFANKDIAGNAQQDLLEQAIRSATALHEFYSAIDRQRSSSVLPASGATWSEQKIAAAARRLSQYVRQQRELYFPQGQPLGSQQRKTMGRFFPDSLVTQVRITELGEQGRLLEAPFQEEAKLIGIENVPKVAHMSSATFQDVLVFNEEITARVLFHALVHAVQFQVLGLDRYCELFVRSFHRRKAYFNVPLEVHAYSLEAKFAASGRGFSVVEEVSLWLAQGSYLS